MGGITVFPLGQDLFGNEYWQFPSSEDLFIARNPSPGVPRPDVDRDEFNRIFHKNQNSTAEKAVTDDGRRSWLRVTKTHQIRQLIELLNEQIVAEGADSSSSSSKALLTLRTNIVNSILAKRLVHYDIARSKQLKQQQQQQSQQSQLLDISSAEVKPVEETAVVQSAIEEVKPRVKPLPDQVPVEIRLNTNKGIEMPDVIVIDSELVFDAATLDEDVDRDSDPSESYFTLAKKKYFAITMNNAGGQLVKARNWKGDQARSVVYTVRREGVLAQTLLEAELNVAWDDHIFYFSALSFHKSGVYTITFHVKNIPNSPVIKPLVYKVVVETRSYRCGWNAALEQLNAKKHIFDDHRLIVHGRRELLSLTTQSMTNNAFAAVRSALVSVYLALPNGALSGDNNEVTSAGSGGAGTSFRGRPSRENVLLEGLLEPTGWNSVLEQTWRGAVLAATTAAGLMECLLVLEFHVNKSNYFSVQGRLWSALPSAHFAVRCATLSAVSMRIFCLDKALDFNKIIVPPRDKRSSMSRAVLDYEPVNNTKAKNPHRNSAPPELAARSARSAAQAAQKKLNKYRDQSEDDDEEDEEEEDDDDDDDNDDNHDEDEEDDNAASDDSSPRPGRGGGGRGRGRGRPPTGRRSSMNERHRRRSLGVSDQDDDDNDDIEHDGGVRRSGRSTTAKSYNEDSDNDDEMNEEDDEQPKPHAVKRVAKRKYLDDEDDEADFDEKGTVFSKKKVAETATVVVSKKPVVSIDQQYADYVRSLPQQVAAFSASIVDYAQHSSQLSPEEYDHNIRFLSILRRLKHDQRTFFFWEPVDRSVAGYYDIIDEPMDLGTILQRVKSNRYEGNVKSFVAVSHNHIVDLLLLF
jgi:hypothetical protein